MDITCPQCKQPNRADARFCKKCGKTLIGSAAAPQDSDQASKKDPLIEKLPGYMDKVMNAVGTAGKIAGQVGSELLKAAESGVSNWQDQGSLHSKNRHTKMKWAVEDKKQKPGRVKLTGVGGLLSECKILGVKKLDYSNCYQARWLRCINCRHLNTLEHAQCTECSANLPIVLLHELKPGRVLVEAEARDEICALSQNASHILTHLRISNNQAWWLHVIVSHPQEEWDCLAERIPAQNADTAIHWCRQIGQALKHIHARQYGFFDEGVIGSPEEPVIISKSGDAYLADLSSCLPFELLGEQPQRKDVRYLGQLLYLMLTGQRENVMGKDFNKAGVPSNLQPVLDGVRQGHFDTIDDFLDHLTTGQAAPVQRKRGISQVAAAATDVGKTRDHNEDFVGKFSLGLAQLPGAPEVGLYIVADGMGGHQAGEKASDEVVRGIVTFVQQQMHHLQEGPRLQKATVRLDEMQTPADILKQSVLRANQTLYKVRQNAHSNRGTTLTAAIIVGDDCAVANVGDSRTYLLRGNKLEQITEDHSLVYSMYKGGMIKKEEFRTHPDRNVILRSLGDEKKVEVDIFRQQLRPGDRLLLCSDGLWEMVDEDAIERILRQASSPTTACDLLIDAANRGGGEDNISAVIVWLE